MDPIMLEEIKELLKIYGGGGIKSIQRGTLGAVNVALQSTKYINISPVDLSKAVLFINSEYVDTNRHVEVALQSNRISIVNNEGTRLSVAFSWQVIEFK